MSVLWAETSGHKSSTPRPTPNLWHVIINNRPFIFSEFHSSVDSILHLSAINHIYAWQHSHFLKCPYQRFLVLSVFWHIRHRSWIIPTAFYYRCSVTSDSNTMWYECLTNLKQFGPFFSETPYCFRLFQFFPYCMLCLASAFLNLSFNPYQVHLACGRSSQKVCFG